MPTFKTDDFVLVDHTDQTKAVQFSVSNSTAGALSTLTIPPPNAANSFEMAALHDFGNDQTWDHGIYSDIFLSPVVVYGAGFTIKSQTGLLLSFDVEGISANRSASVPNVSGIMALDTSIVCYDGDVVTYDDDLVSI